MEVRMRGRRSRNYFTQDQIIELAANPYTAAVTASSIRYTPEFKEMFWQRYQNGEMVKAIFRSAGYDTDVLGDGRIYNFSHQLAVSKNMISDLIQDSQRDEPASKEKTRLSAMEHELRYLRQQVDFLKKLSSLENSRKPGQ